MNDIKYYSNASKVNMADSWFEIAKLDHFWVRRRFQVLKTLLGSQFRPSGEVAEFGCGHGLVQAQFHKSYEVKVDGYELNEFALTNSIAKDQPRIVYDIHDRMPELKEKYNLIIMFDVIEHIKDDSAFLDSALYHLAKGGLLAVNVPAFNWLFSRYDQEQGHFRRYTLTQLENLGKAFHLSIKASTYWCMPMVPMLLLRKAILTLRKGEQAVVQSGFSPPSTLANTLLHNACKLEFLPQRFVGTSAMCIFGK